MTNSDVKTKYSKAVAYSTDEHGNIVIDINTKVVLSDKMADAYNITPRNPPPKKDGMPPKISIRILPQKLETQEKIQPVKTKQLKKK